MKRAAPFHASSLASLFALVVTACSPSSPAPAHIAAAQQAPSGLTPSEAEASSRVTAAAIDAPLRYLSDDLLEGRGPGTRGSDLAIRYIAAEMEAMGLQPGATEGAGASWFQRVPLVGIKSQLPATATFVSKGSAATTATLSIPKDLIVDAGVQEAKIAL